MPPDRRVRPAAAKDLCLTIDNPEEGMEVEIRRLLDLHCQYWVNGREVGAHGTPPPPPIGRICPVQSQMLPGDSNE